MADRLPPSVYANEYRVLQRQSQQTDDFRELLTRFPESTYGSDVLWSLRVANARATVLGSASVLDSSAIQELKKARPEIFAVIAPVYSQFLNDKLGL